MDWNRSIGRRSLLKALGTGTAAYLLSGCASSPPAQSPIQTSAGSSRATAMVRERVVRMAAVQGQGLFEAPNAFGIRTGSGQQQAFYIFDSLVWRDSSPDPIPWLAEKWSHTADGLTWTFTLRNGLKFQDGAPLTAEDVVFSYQYLPRYPTTYYNGLSEQVKEIQAIDERTVQMVLPEPMAPFIERVAIYTPILPKHIWRDVSDPLKFKEPEAFMGSGPYRLSSMNEADSSFLFTANESFFLGKPYVNRIEFVPAADDLIALKAGKLDVASPVAYVGLTNDTLAPFRSDPKYSIIEAPGEGVTALYFNHRKGAPYTNSLFRQAIAHAIDKKEIVNRLLGGNAEPGSPGCLPPSNPFSTKDVQQYPYDQGKARRLLAQAGFQEEGGQWQSPNGSPLTIPLLFGSGESRVAEIIQSMLGRIGVKVDLRAADQGTASQLQGAGNYEAAIVTHGGLGGDPDTHMFRIFNSPETSKHWQKCWGYHSDRFDKLAREQRRTLDREKRASVLWEMQRALSEDVPVIHLFYPNRYVIYDPQVFDGWYFTPLSNPLAMNKHFFVTGQKTGLTIRQD